MPPIAWSITNPAVQDFLRRVISTTGWHGQLFPCSWWRSAELPQHPKKQEEHRQPPPDAAPRSWPRGLTGRNDTNAHED